MKGVSLGLHDVDVLLLRSLSDSVWGCGGWGRRGRGEDKPKREDSVSPSQRVGKQRVKIKDFYFSLELNFFPS